MTGEERPRVVIVDDHPLLAQALCGELERSGTVVEQLDPNLGPRRLVAAISTDPPDCAVLDLGLPIPGGGAALVEPIVENGIRVAVLTGETDRCLLAQSAMAGASVVLSKTEELNSIVETIQRVAAGEEVRPRQRDELAAELRQLNAERRRRQAPFEELSRREQEVLAGLMEGQKPADLAERHFVSVATVRSQVKSLLGKLGVGSQLEAVALAHRSDWRPGGDG